ncbi:hypothetical protein [Helicobacter salomonis]|uniref:hypothetical protein n=1 Tax=Helicobacter salomonis TaxID=56878 RepID=UPI0013159398|nr:hypothetical protein [Helicobacter salomonis]
MGWMSVIGGLNNGWNTHRDTETKPPTKYQQYKAEIEAVKKSIEDKQAAFDALQKPMKG